ncbi:MAG TPA: Tim44-like domain-containing protein [Usitatibacter sp.]|nr:Tim44-like domain-containing protein [Usitatibacter sp.]
MKNSLPVLLFSMALGLVSLDADAQRFGGGKSFGKQRPAPTMRQAPKPADTAPPASSAAAPAKTAPGAAPAAPAPKPSFMSRWGGLLAGLGIGALLASMFGAQMGPIIGMILMVLLLALVGFVLFRLFAGRKGPGLQPAAGAASPAGAPPMQFSGIGSRLEGTASPGDATEAPAPAAADPAAVLGSEVEPFLRVAKTSFIRLQAANDSGDLDDIRDYTTPEMYAEVAMQVQERAGKPQRTEIVSVNARLDDAAVEGDYAIASVRFTGLIRMNDAANPEPFDEVWHVRRNLRERNGSWLIAGIQQVA